MRTVVITRHAALVQYMREIGLIDERAEVLPHAGPDDVRGAHVIGPLPLHLAALADRITQVPIRFDRDSNMRGVELTLEQVRAMAGPPETYVVRRIEAEVRP